MKIFKKFKNYQKKRLKDIWSNPSQGFGDTFYKIADSLYIPHCFGCIKRRRKWNKKLQYKKQRFYVYFVKKYLDEQNKSEIIAWFNDEQSACDFVGSLKNISYKYASVSQYKEGALMGEVIKQWYILDNNELKEVHPKDIQNKILKENI